MRLLLDTHAFIWWAADDQRLSDTAATALDDANIEIWFSPVSIWEMAVKTAKAKLRRGDEFLDHARTLIETGRFQELPVTAAHAAAVRSLPRLHGDPFDRLLICQATTESMTLVTADKKIAAYDVARFW